MLKFSSFIGLAAIASCHGASEKVEEHKLNYAVVTSRAAGEFLDEIFASVANAPGARQKPLSGLEIDFLRAVESNVGELRSFSSPALSEVLGQQACKVDVPARRLFLAEVYEQAHIQLTGSSLDCLLARIPSEDLGLWKTLEMWNTWGAAETNEVRLLRGRAQDSRTLYRLMSPAEFQREMDAVVPSDVIEAKLGAPR